MYTLAFLILPDLIDELSKLFYIVYFGRKVVHIINDCKLRPKYR